MLKLIYYPNKLEMYANSLRLIYQKLILKDSIKPKYLDNLRKIYEFEATMSDSISPLNLEKFCSELFTAVIFYKHFNYNIQIKGNYLVNQKVLTCILLNIARKSEFVKMYILREKIVIKSKFKPDKILKKLVGTLGGIMLKSLNTKTVYIQLNFEKTEKKTTGFHTAFYHCIDPLSPVNLYLNSQ